MNATSSQQNTPHTLIPLQVIKRNGQRVPYEEDKIRIAISKAFLAVEGQQAADSTRIHEQVSRITSQVTAALIQRIPQDGLIHIESIQDQVELALMRLEEHPIARAYVLYREARRTARENENKLRKKPSILVRLANGQEQPLDFDLLRTRVLQACQGLSAVDPDFIMEKLGHNLYNGIPEVEIDKALIITVRSLVEQDSDYNKVTTRFLLSTLYREAHSFLNLPTSNLDYPKYFQAYIDLGIALELLDPALKGFDLVQLGQALQSEQDQRFSYLGLQTLYDRYFLHHAETRFELPQAFFMRVAMGLSLNEANKNARAIEFYQVLSNFDYMASTPTLFNAGTLRPQLSSCFLTTIPDDLEGIYSSIKDNALLSKFAGGLGNDWTPVRAMGATIKGTNGKSQGIVPFLNVADASAVAVNQGGKRKGAVCAYLETWHLDIEEFLELRKNTGDDRRRTHDMNTANWVPDLFMERVINNEQWTLFSPNEVLGLHDAYGEQFKTLYKAYEAQAKQGKIKHFKQLPAVNLWRKMLTALFETGHPWITFKDACNLRSPQQHVGVVHSSNLCTEITLNTSQKEIAVCNLGSINLAQHLTATGELNQEKIKSTVYTAMRMLDNVIDINYYTVPQAKHANQLHRPVGLGIMGFQDVLFQKRLNFDSSDTLNFADQSMELISYYAIEASSELAKARGKYSSFEGSLWSQGILPIHSIELLRKTRNGHLDQDSSTTLDWEALRIKVMQDGMRNSNCLAIAPTATISNICNVIPSIEPIYQNLFVKSNMSGEFTIINPYLVADLKRLNLWDSVMLNDLKYYDGSIQKIDRIPDSLKSLYATAFELDPLCLIEAASRRQKWLDQSQSLNLFMAQVSGKQLDKLYKQAWIKGVKTTYYLRTLGASHTEKSTVARTTLNAVPVTQSSSLPAQPVLSTSCRIDDAHCEACE